MKRFIPQTHYGFLWKKRRSDLDNTLAVLQNYYQSKSQPIRRVGGWLYGRPELVYQANNDSSFPHIKAAVLLQWRIRLQPDCISECIFAELRQYFTNSSLVTFRDLAKESRYARRLIYIASKVDPNNCTLLENIGYQINYLKPIPTQSPEQTSTQPRNIHTTDILTSHRRRYQQHRLTVASLRERGILFSPAAIQPVKVGDEPLPPTQRHSVAYLLKK